MLHGFARTATDLSIFRLLLGAGESGNFMAAFKVTSEWYPPKERAFVNGLVNAGAAVGAIIATPLVTWLALTWGWRTAFVVTGSFGLLWLVAWWFLYYVPGKHPYITDAERDFIAHEKITAPSERASIRYIDLLKLPQTWGLLLSRFVSDPVWWFYLFWLPKYMVERRSFTMVEMGMLTWLPYLSADIGSVVGGLWSGWLVKRGTDPLRARTFTLLPFALMMPLSLVIAYTPSSAIALAVVCVVTFAHMGWKTNMMTVTNDIYPTRVVGSVAGILAFGTGLGGTLFTNLTGYIVEHHSYDLIFIIMGFLHPAAYVIYRLLVRKPVFAA
jgi:ACS family hexuronate transporter-like MFS transporter